MLGFKKKEQSIEEFWYQMIPSKDINDHRILRFDRARDTHDHMGYYFLLMTNLMQKSKI